MVQNTYQPIQLKWLPVYRRELEKFMISSFFTLEALLLKLIFIFTTWRDFFIQRANIQHYLSTAALILALVILVCTARRISLIGVWILYIRSAAVANNKFYLREVWVFLLDFSIACFYNILNTMRYNPSIIIHLNTISLCSPNWSHSWLDLKITRERSSFLLDYFLLLIRKHHQWRCV